MSLHIYVHRRKVRDAEPRVDQYVSLLEAHLGKPEFWNIYRQLSGDLSMQEQVELAKKFSAGGSVSSAKEGMRRIARRQQQLEVAQRKDLATGGRSAG